MKLTPLQETTINRHRNGDLEPTLYIQNPIDKPDVIILTVQTKKRSDVISQLHRKRSESDGSLWSRALRVAKFFAEEIGCERKIIHSK